MSGVHRCQTWRTLSSGNLWNCLMFRSRLGIIVNHPLVTLCYRYLPSSTVTGNVTGVQNGRIMWCPGQSQMLWNCVAATQRLAPGKVKLFSEWRAASQLHMRMRHLMCQLQLQSLVHSQCGIVTRRQIFTLYIRAVNKASQCPETTSSTKASFW